jgi:hypothetical protein
MGPPPGHPSPYLGGGLIKQLEDYANILRQALRAIGDLFSQPDVQMEQSLYIYRAGSALSCKVGNDTTSRIVKKAQ